MLPDRSMTKYKFGGSLVTSRNVLPQNPCASGDGATAPVVTHPSLGGVTTPDSGAWKPASSASERLGGNTRPLHEARKHPKAAHRTKRCNTSQDGSTDPDGYPKTSLARERTAISTA